ncbi:hypothetical protein Q3G72_021122 [Acer saccharum]|nr:hypothetical protein Q3G72_021122 [Acer saccharum]
MFTTQRLVPNSKSSVPNVKSNVSGAKGTWRWSPALDQLLVFSKWISLGCQIVDCLKNSLKDALGHHINWPKELVVEDSVIAVRKKVEETEKVKRPSTFSLGINFGFRMFQAQAKTQPSRKNLKWSNVNAPIQPGNVECGYYVMRYMKEIIENHDVLCEKVKKTERMHDPKSL